MLCLKLEMRHLGIGVLYTVMSVENDQLDMYWGQMQV